MSTQIENLSKVWPGIKTMFTVPHSYREYKNLVKILDELIDEIGDKENHQLSPVMETIGKLIENYEEQNYTIENSTAVDALKYLMKEHSLKQTDLNEIGSQGVVSEVLAGKRDLNIEQIKKISKKFNISPVVFI